MIACLGIALWAGLGVGQCATFADQAALSRPRKHVVQSVAICLILFQFVGLRYEVQAQIPTPNDRVLWADFVSRLAQLPGEVWVFNHGYVADIAGRRTYAHSVPYVDAAGLGLLGSRTEENRLRRERVQSAVQGAVHDQFFEWVVTGVPAADWLPYYLETELVFGQGHIPFSVTGAAGPEGLLRRNPVARGGSLPITDSSWDALFVKGWGNTEEWGRWSVGTESVIQLAMEKDHNYGLMLQVFPSCSSSEVKQAMEVRWNGQSVGRYVFSVCETRAVDMTIPEGMITGGVDSLSFHFQNASFPLDAELANDQESETVGFSALRLIQEEK
jgi:hypothetical protein